MVQNGIALQDIATELERHPMTIRRRITQLGLE
jgi:IS30 family transposase